MGGHSLIPLGSHLRVQHITITRQIFSKLCMNELSRKHDQLNNHQQIELMFLRRA